MPPLSRWFMKASFIPLALALLCELLPVRSRGLWPAIPDAALHLGAVHLLTVGWLLQLITGVAFWMFPRHPTAPPRGDPRPGWLGFGLLNVGLLTRLVGEPWRLVFGGPTWPLAVSAVLQFAAVLLLIHLLWPRIREMRS